MRRTVEILGALTGVGIFIAHYAKSVATWLGVLFIPADAWGVLTAMSQIPTIVAVAGLLIGLGCFAYLVHDSGGLRVVVADAKVRAAKLEPLHLIGFGAIVVLAGIAWQIFQGRTPLPSPQQPTTGAFFGSPPEIVRDGRFEWRELKGILPGTIHSDGTHYVRQVYFQGTYKGPQPMVLEDVTITSRITAEKLRLKVMTDPDYVFPEELNPIPPDARLVFQGLLYNPDDRNRDGTREGITAKEMLARWGGFTLELKYRVDGHSESYSRIFDYQSIAEMLAPPKQEPPLPVVTKRAK